jgi:hypothetical protein
VTRSAKVKKKGKPQLKLTDRERILMAIIAGLKVTASLGPHNGMIWSSEPYRNCVHFAPWDKPKAGDLVIGDTGGLCRWKIGFYVEPLGGDFGGAVIREIGSDTLCNYSNENFTPIRNMNPSDLYEGDEYLFYHAVLRAFGKGDEYLYRFGGIDFEGETAKVWIREAFGGLRHDSVPFVVEMPWKPVPGHQKILSALRAGGYGTRAFETNETQS